MTTTLLPPLVEPGAELTPAELQRYSRHLLMPEVGFDGQRRLKNAKVLVLGAGGLGSPALLYLAAAGVGTLGIVDFDTVETSNLQRQIIHTDRDVGRAKAVSAAESIAEANPLVTTVLHQQRLTADNALDVFSAYDVVLDGTDNFETRYLVNDACVLLGKPYVWGSIFRFEGQASVFWAKHGPQYRDVYPVPPPPGSVPSCAEGGVLGMLCASIGAVMSTEAVKLICGIGRSLLGRLLVYNALEMSYRTVPLRPDPAATPVTKLVDYEAFCGVGQEAGGAPYGTGGGVNGAAAGNAAGNAAASNAAASNAANPASIKAARKAAIDAATVTARQLKTRIDAHDGVLVVDVREPAEHALVAIDGDVLIPRDRIVSGAALDELPRDRDVVLYCKSGVRSAECLASLQAAGYTRAQHLAGGVLAWVNDIAPTLPRY